MTTQHIIEPGQAVHQAAAILSSLEYINQAEARSLGSLAEAVANAFMVVYYQAETGRATQADFQEAMNALRQACS
ncbi:type I toxin-antitoxin system ptaRNA1 family toxin [Escherichia coli]|uniref:type I toxin-antitoxin system ptaRNA1 family toxin n=1 Tax=Escherichia coli TaxID=562 RepID=UPI00182313EC|nr:type I toxin-antitoxin system ptaRNA1 family toxin [Escherichia coli]EEU9170366.1 type I toxin-antitoxin system ptaRNA1 family toxin [Escherichia coli]EFB5551992.1 type I toxin-antitoxin system ptaRNA1 family toxin [Escherichia coli]EFH4922566.1 type I toxin-antitoxin system ptaRNA1 family toxin [Escherichia coli]EHB7827136.1 type I toxin-antitoxin system ptaRNA1 family toxin [Escherichia coli]EHH4570074.1 type I toxin-antitoxin system ptaRNA1 family toxin [Escherichia coli]